MKPRLIDYTYLFLTVALTAYGQIVVKWRVGMRGHMPADTSGKMRFLGALLLDPGVMSGLLAAFVAALSWMAAMTKFQLSYAYPFVSLSFVAVLLLSAVFLKEPITVPKVAGVALILVGTFVATR